ncbi:hypothetical protein FBR02_05640 [Anaerolineae bacterium CFX9]|jgi:hypothetical protein|nr:hypothetical protein [Anaerolineae bacterium CFX9]
MRDPSVRYSLTAMERTAVKAEMRDILIAAARARETITYSGLAERIRTVHIHAHSFIFTRLLREVCADADAAGDGFLCALVVSKATGMPSGGYFQRDLADKLSEQDLEAIWRDELESVYALWASR